jgi:1-acyl-sn-glycerol-3-phosphate acyltransferase
MKREDLFGGVANAALRHQVPILPVGVAGTEKGQRGHITVSFGRLIAVPELTTSYVRRQVSHGLMDLLYYNLSAQQHRAIEISHGAGNRSIGISKEFLSWPN